MNRSKDLDIIAPDDPISLKEPAVCDKCESVMSSVENDEINNLLKTKIHKNTFSSFMPCPKDFSFINQNEGKIFLVVRRHWFTNLPWIVISFIMLFAPFFLSNIFNGNSQANILNLFFPERLSSIFIIFWFLITFIYAFEQFITWYFNVFIITEHRVIDIDFYNLIDKKIAEASISHIQDIKVKSIGVSQTIFNYGTVYIQTAAHLPVITAVKIPNPNMVLQILQKMRKIKRSKQGDPSLGK